MSTPISILLFPVGSFSLPVSGDPHNAISKTFYLSQTGTLRFASVGVTTGPAGVPPSPFELNFKIIDPDGKEFLVSPATKMYEIKDETLAQYRDAAGFSSRPWTAQISNAGKAAVSGLTVSAGLAPFGELTISAAPLLNNTGA